VQAMKAHEVRR